MESLLLARRHRAETDARVRADAARYHEIIREAEDEVAAAEHELRATGFVPPTFTSGDDVTDVYEADHRLLELERAFSGDPHEVHRLPMHRLLTNTIHAANGRLYLDHMADELETRMLRRSRPFVTRNPDGTPIAARRFERPYPEDDTIPPVVAARPIPNDVVRAHVLPFLNDGRTEDRTPYHQQRRRILPPWEFRPDTPAQEREHPWPRLGSGAPPPSHVTGGMDMGLENTGLHGLFTALHAALGALRDARGEVAEIKDRAARAAPPVRAELEADLDDLRKIIRKIQRRIDALRAAIADREATVPTHADVVDPRLSSRPRGPLRER